jgi:hypothetical protein
MDRHESGGGLYRIYSGAIRPAHEHPPELRDEILCTWITLDHKEFVSGKSSRSFAMNTVRPLIRLVPNHLAVAHLPRICAATTF